MINHHLDRVSVRLHLTVIASLCPDTPTAKTNADSVGLLLTVPPFVIVTGRLAKLAQVIIDLRCYRQLESAARTQHQEVSGLGASCSVRPVDTRLCTC